jgi:hypothetical protein
MPLSSNRFLFDIFVSGGPPAVAIFATNARYKRESYRGSEFAPKILAENGLTVLMKAGDVTQRILRALTPTFIERSPSSRFKISALRGSASALLWPREQPGDGIGND